MRNISIKVIVPKKGNPWKLSIGKSTGKHFASGSSVYTSVERHLLANREAKVKEKNVEIKIKVDYNLLHSEDPEGWENEGTYKDTSTALYSLACFLEDYVGGETLKKKLKQYGGNL